MCYKAIATHNKNSQSEFLNVSREIENISTQYLGRDLNNKVFRSFIVLYL